MVKKTLLQWHWALEGPAANFDSEIAMCTLEVGMAETDRSTFLILYDLLAKLEEAEHSRTNRTLLLE